MSYYIAEEITITPDKIISVGYSNNVFPQESVVSELPRTELELQYIVSDLIGGMIEPKQKFWRGLQKELRQRYSWEDMSDKEKVADAAQVMMARYDHEVLNKTKRNVFMYRDKLPTCMEYYLLVRDYAKREGVGLDQARSIVGLFTGREWYNYYTQSNNG